MGRTHLLAGACVALTVLFYVAGCAGKPPESARRQGAAAASAGPRSNNLTSSGRGARRPEAPDVSAAEAAPQSIAHHAEAYAQNLESLLARRGATPPANAEPAPATPEPQDSDGGANGSLRVGPAEPGQAVAAAAEEAAATQVSPKQVAPKQAAPAATPAGQKPEPTGAAKSDDVVIPSTLPLPTARSLTQSPEPAAPTFPLLQKLSARAREYPRDAAAQLDYQLLQFLREEPVPELGAIAALPAEDRELLTALIDGLSNFRSGLRADMNMLHSKKVSPLLEMSERLRVLGELTLPTAVLCTRVDRFGVYEPMEPAQFKAGAANEAILYCEVANFSSQIGDNRQWETRLRHECVLYSEAGLAVWRDKSDSVTDTSRNRRQDFYVVKRLRVPAMPVGRYLLKVTVTDLQLNRVAEKTVPIQVITPER